MKRSALINRREFAKLAGGAALVAPLASSLAWTQEPAKKPDAPAAPAQQADKPKPEPPTGSGQAPLKLSKEQEEAVKKAVERRDRQLVALRSRALPYNAEPAFIFQVRQRPRGGPKK
jgi:Spy/CpxP family protein refolding chaperone